MHQTQRAKFSHRVEATALIGPCTGLNALNSVNGEAVQRPHTGQPTLIPVAHAATESWKCPENGYRNIMNCASNPQSETRPAVVESFTVLMAVYNKDDPERFDAALSSVFANSQVPDAVLIIADGPLSDGTGRCCPSDLTQQDTLKLHRLAQNQGLAAALNAGLLLVETEWVVRANYDDYNHSDRFAKQAAGVLAMRNGSLDLLGSAKSRN